MSNRLPLYRTTFLQGLLLVMLLLIGVIFSVSQSSADTNPENDQYFNMLVPPHAVIVNDPSSIRKYVWDQVNGVNSYDWQLKYNNPVTGAEVRMSLTGLTPEDDADALLCLSGYKCFLTVASGDSAQAMNTTGAYTWHLTGYGSSTSYSDFNSFSVDPAAPPTPTPTPYDDSYKAITIVSPAVNTNLTAAAQLEQLTWLPVPGVTGYELIMYYEAPAYDPYMETWYLDGVGVFDASGNGVGNGTFTAAADGDALTCDSSLCTYTLSPADAAAAFTRNGLYKWVIFNENENDYQANGQFTLALPSPAPERFAPFAPKFSSVVPEVLTWEVSPHATSYRLWIKQPGKQEKLIKVKLTSSEASCSNGLCSVNVSSLPLNKPLKEGKKYIWRVIAINELGVFKGTKLPFTIRVAGEAAANSDLINLPAADNASLSGK